MRLAVGPARTVLELAGLLAALLASACGPDTGSVSPTIHFDESLEEFFSIRDPGFMGYARAADALRGRGYRVRSNDRPLAEFLPSLEPARRHLLVLHPWLGGEWPEADLAAARAFVRRGGSVIFFTEHDDVYGSASAANALVRDAGIRVVAGRAAADHDPEGPLGPITVVDRDEGPPGRMYFAAPLEVGRGNEVLARDRDGRPVAAASDVGRGRVVVAGDSEFLWNGTRELGLRDRGNRRWLFELVDAASVSRGGGDAPGARDAAAGRLSPDRFRHLVDTLLAAGLEVRVPARPGSTHGTASRPGTGPADVVLLPEPTGTVPSLPSPSSGGAKVLALLSAASSAPDVGAPFGARLRPAARYHPLASHLSERGIEMHAAVLRRRDGSFEVEGSGEAVPRSCRWRRASALEVDRTELPGAEVVARSPAPADPVLLWPASGSGGAQPVLRDGPGGEGWPVVVRSPALLVLASGAPLADGREGTECYRAVVELVLDWAASG